MTASAKTFSLFLIIMACAAVARAQEDVIPLRGAPTTGASATGSISGRVVLPNGQPVPGRVRIKLSTITDPGQTLYTDNNGGFGFRGLREGVYTLEAEGDRKHYDPVVQEVRLIRGTHVRLLINLKEKGEEGNKKPESVVSLAELEQQVPSSARKEFDRGSKLANQGKIQEAIEQFKKAISIYPDYLMARNDLGVQYLKLKRPAEALEHFEAALAVNSKVFNPRLNLAIALVEMKRYVEALDHLNQAISIDSSSPSAHLYLGIATLETDELDAAERELGKAHILGGEQYAVVHFYLASVHLKKGDREGAIRELSAYLEKSPGGEHAARARTLLENIRQ